MTDADWPQSPPDRREASTGTDHRPLPTLSAGQLAKAAEGGDCRRPLPLQFRPISVSDGISMGHGACTSHWSAAGRRLSGGGDGTSTLTAWSPSPAATRSLPGMLMARRCGCGGCVRLRGLDLPGRLGDKDVTIIDAFEAVGACASGSSPDRSMPWSRHLPGEGACGGMYAANTMASAAEAMGMSLPGLHPGSGPSPRRDRPRLRRRRRGADPPGHHRPRDIITRGVAGERDRGSRHGFQRLHQRGAAPAAIAHEAGGPLMGTSTASGQRVPLLADASTVQALRDETTSTR